jgi:hypothetical protein
MIQQLVVNGCSYAESYAGGNGHVDLASRLGIVDHHNIPQAVSLAIGGSANSRILRTTLKHSYVTRVPTLYVLGLTFVSRLELPICNPVDEFEGAWCNPQNQEFESRWQHQWTKKDSEQFVETKLKSEVYSILDRTEDIMYRVISTITDIQSRGHRVLIFQQADNLYQAHLSNPRLKLFQRPEIIEGFAWRAIAWQYEQGVRPKTYPFGSPDVPPDMTHPEIGQHELINQYLTNYIQEHKILA